MAAPDLGISRPLAPVASVWCRQVDHEAESPGYTAIPDEFPGRRETLDAIRLVGNLTINVADTHDYWDPDPSSTLSYYPNLFVYPAAAGRYTCVGRMFLSTEDRPRLGMKTLVFYTADLVATGAFGEVVLRALQTLDGRTERPRPVVEPDPAVYQAVGEGFLFHRGTTEPVVVVASDQWEAACQATREIIRAMPASLVSLGAFLVFPYFLPAAKIDLRQFTEEVPLALAVMRVPRQEAEGERHAKRMQSWEDLPVSLRDLTRPAGRSKEALPLVLQHIRDHAEGKEFEVARRVDQVEGPRMQNHLTDPDRQLGRDRRREMWRIGTAMETAALLLSRPKGRTVKVSAETQKRANQYLDATPGESPQLASTLSTSPSPSVPIVSATPPPPPAPSPTPIPAAPVDPAATVPSWLRPAATIAPVPQDPAGVPVPKSDDLSGRPAPFVAPSPPPAAPAPAVPPPRTAYPPAVPVPRAAEPIPSPPAPPPIDLAALDARITRAVGDAERRWSEAADVRTRAAQEASDKASRETLAALARRLETLEARPVTNPEAIATDLDAKVRAWADLKFLESDRRLDQTVLEPLIALVHRVEAVERRPIPTAEALSTELEARIGASFDRKLANSDRRSEGAAQAAAEAWAERIRRELRQGIDELAARASRSEEELRTSLAAQIDLEVLEAKEQGTALREELEGRVRELLEKSFSERERKRAADALAYEQRTALLVEGRAKEIEQRLSANLAQSSERLTALTDDRISHVERRLGAERDARLAEFTEAHRAAVGALQTRLQGYVDQRLRDGRTEDEQRTSQLATRLRSEIEASVDRKLSDPAVAAALDTRIRTTIEAERGQDAAELSRVVADARSSIASAQEEAVARLAEVEQRAEAREAAFANLEESIRTELDDLDRRLMVVNDHVLPLVRQTWLKVSEQEFAARAKVTEARLAAVRQELSEEVRRVEGELLQQQSDLRDRLEAWVASHGRIWLNLLRQLSPDGGTGLPTEALPPSHRFPRRARVASPAVPSVAETDAIPANAVPFASDPPNPMDPELGQELERKEPPRRFRRA